MNIFYGSSKDRTDIPGDSPIHASLNMALEVFRGLDLQNGFMGINLTERFIVQFALQKRGGVRVELLDTSGPAWDACIADIQFAEDLIQAAANGQDVFQVARASAYEWEHTQLG
jgi:hypothetical protein